jgi:hypothetical protein
VFLKNEANSWSHIIFKCTYCCFTMILNAFVYKAYFLNTKQTHEVIIIFKCTDCRCFKFYKACFLKTKRIQEDISYLNARTAGVLIINAFIYKTCFLKTKQTHEVIIFKCTDWCFKYQCVYIKRVS